MAIEHILLFFNLETGSDHLRAVFGHMGLGDKEIVALSGAHTLVGSALAVEGICVYFSLLSTF